MAKVTVAVIAYYREFLGECIASVLAQTYRDIEVVVYDDKSPEDLRSVVSSFDDPRLRYIRNETNLRSFGNTNKAIDCCDTEYINVFHGDDRMFPWMIEKLARVLDEQPTVGFAASSRNHVMRPSSVKGTIGALPVTVGKHYAQGELLRHTAATGDSPIVSPSTMLRKSAIDAVNLRYKPEMGPAADTYFALEANAAGVEIYLVREALLEYREHGQSLTSRSDAEIWAATRKHHVELIERALPGVDTSALRARIASSVLARVTAASGDDLAAVAAWRAKLTEQYGLVLPDAMFHRTIAKSYLRDYIMLIGEKRGTREAYRARRRRIKALGLPIPLHKEVEWFVKYVVFAGKAS